MAKSRNITTFRCNQCGRDSAKWHGRCPGCGEWSSMQEEPTADREAADIIELALAEGSGRRAAPLTEISADAARHRPTGLKEVDGVLGGGLVPCGAVLLVGEPGVGKSTLLLQICDGFVASGGLCFLATAEESPEQVKLRADRIGTRSPRILVAGVDSIAEIVGQMHEIRPALVVVDSIQTVHDPRITSAAGSVAQVRECAATLTREAKGLGAAIILVGHVTKDGSIAGPRTLEHLVDVVLGFEGDRRSTIRMLRSVKNRFGPAGELGLFRMDEGGLAGVDDAGALFLSDHDAGEIPGSAICAAVEGRRSLLVEVQALVAMGGGGRRSVTSLDPNRFNVLCGVLAQSVLGERMAAAEVYGSVIGGARITDPALDLGLCAALASSALGVPCPRDTVFVGEVGLGGELRSVADVVLRARAAERYGLARMVIGSCDVEGARAGAGDRMEVVGVRRVAEAVALLDRAMSSPIGHPPDPLAGAGR